MASSSAVLETSFKVTVFKCHVQCPNLEVSQLTHLINNFTDGST